MGLALSQVKSRSPLYTLHRLLVDESKDFRVLIIKFITLRSTFEIVSDSLFFLTLGLAGSLEVGKSLGLRFSVR